eukprot:12929505-Prorocentrum_lima.AAC.1
MHIRSHFGSRFVQRKNRELMHPHPDPPLPLLLCAWVWQLREKVNRLQKQYRSSMLGVEARPHASMHSTAGSR